jgi:hypothetical protein
MTRTAARLPAASLAVLGIALGVVACGPAAETPADAAFQGPRNTNSSIAGETLRCPGDYPDSVLVFAPDGTLSGRYAGEPVSGEWSALGPERVEILLRAGGIAVRDTMRRTSAGWRGENTACG